MIEKQIKTELNAHEAFRRIRSNATSSFILESAENDKSLGRYSFVGFNPEMIVDYRKGVLNIGDKTIATQDPFSELRKLVRARESRFNMPGFVWRASWLSFL